jgi:hypothetical protein
LVVVVVVVVVEVLDGVCNHRTMISNPRQPIIPSISHSVSRRIVLYSSAEEECLASAPKACAAAARTSGARLFAEDGAAEQLAGPQGESLGVADPQGESLAAEAPAAKAAAEGRLVAEEAAGVKVRQIL